MFKITGKKGFRITFESGYTVSVQFGLDNLCDNYNHDDLQNDEACGAKGSTTAECAVWVSGEGVFLEHSLFDVGDGTVGKYLTPAQVLELMNWAAAQ